MYFEFLGLSASGKSSLSGKLRQKDKHKNASLTIKPLVVHAKHRKDKGRGTVPRYIFNDDARVEHYRAIQFRSQYSELLRFIETHFLDNPVQYFLYSWTSSLYQAYLNFHKNNAAIFTDEGFLQRGISLLSSANIKDQPKHLGNFLQLLPPIDLLIILEISPEEALERVAQAPWAKRNDADYCRTIVSSRYGDIEAFKKFEELIEGVKYSYDLNNIPYISVDTTMPLKDNVTEIYETLCAVNNTKNELARLQKRLHKNKVRREEASQTVA